MKLGKLDSGFQFQSGFGTNLIVLIFKWVQLDILDGFFWWNLPNMKWEPILFKLEKLVKLMKLVKLDWRFRLQFGFRSVWFLSIDIYWNFSVFERVQLDIFRRFWWTWPNWKLAVVLVKLASW